jgi:single-stranded-DNA-specific exonuclease
LSGATVRSAKNLKGHLKLELSFARREIACFGFELGGLALRFTGGRADVVGRLRRDAWRGGDAVELKIEHVTPVC